ncbi:MAG: hypothetical protein ACOCV2_12415, partial [Persicimonas sp.]
DDTEPSPPELEGTWAHKLVTSSINDAPIIGEVVSQTITYQKLDVEQQGDQLQMTEQTCDVDIKSNQGAVRTTVPDRFVSHINPVERTAELRRHDGDWYLFAPRAVKTFGIRLDDPYADLPTDPNDPRVFDQDEDGKPGMTAEVDGVLSGELHLVQRSWDQWWGEVVDPDHVGGLIDWNTDQVVVSRSGSIFGEISPAEPHPNERQSYFRMARVDDDTDCAEIAQQKDALF